jgi:sarcosine oxidase subunit alpha
MEELRIFKGVERSQSFLIEVDGEMITAYEGETVGTALIAAGKLTFNRSPIKKQPRGFCCGIGVCFSCTMVINGVPNIRACQTPAKPGTKVETQEGLQRWHPDK